MIHHIIILSPTRNCPQTLDRKIPQYIVGWSYPRTTRSSSTTITTLQACASWGPAWLSVHLANWRHTWQTKPISRSPFLGHCKHNSNFKKKIVRNCNWAPLTFNLLLYYSRGGYPTIFNCITLLIIDKITTSKSIYPCHLSIAQRKSQTQDYKPLHTHPTKYDTMPLLGNPTLPIFTKTCTLSSPTS